MIRRATRFKPEPLDLAYVQFSISQKFEPEVCALILNESYTGIAIVMITQFKIETDQIYKVQVGKMLPIEARVVWVKEFEPTVFKVGLEFIEPK